MISITKYSSLPGECATHHLWGAILGVPCTGRFAGWVQTSPCCGCSGVGAQLHSAGQGVPGQPGPPAVQQGARRGSAHQWDSASCSSAERFAESSKGFAAAEARPWGERAPGMQESLPSNQRGADPILTPPESTAGCFLCCVGHPKTGVLTSLSFNPTRPASHRWGIRA